ncbi:MAG: hypothetical protein WB444_10170 [Gallionella sp.]
MQWFSIDVGTQNRAGLVFDLLSGECHEASMVGAGKRAGAALKWTARMLHLSFKINAHSRMLLAKSKANLDAMADMRPAEYPTRLVAGATPALLMDWAV